MEKIGKIILIVAMLAAAIFGTLGYVNAESECEHEESYLAYEDYSALSGNYKYHSHYMMWKCVKCDKITKIESLNEKHILEATPRSYNYYSSVGGSYHTSTYYCTICNQMVEVAEPHVRIAIDDTSNNSSHKLDNECRYCHVTYRSYSYEGHTYSNGICTVCGHVCTHEYINDSDTCRYCGEAKIIEEPIIIEPEPEPEPIEEPEEEEKKEEKKEEIIETGFYEKYWSEEFPVSYFEEKNGSRYYYQYLTEEGYIYFNSVEDTVYYIVGEVDEETMKWYRDTYFKFALDTTTGIYGGPEEPFMIVE